MRVCVIAHKVSLSYCCCCCSMPAAHDWRLRAHFASRSQIEGQRTFRPTLVGQVTSGAHRHQVTGGRLRCWSVRCAQSCSLPTKAAAAATKEEEAATSLSAPGQRSLRFKSNDVDLMMSSSSSSMRWWSVLKSIFCPMSARSSSREAKRFCFDFELRFICCCCCCSMIFLLTTNEFGWKKVGKRCKREHFLQLACLLCES